LVFFLFYFFGFFYFFRTCSRNKTLLESFNFALIQPKNDSVFVETDQRYATAAAYVHLIHKIREQTDLAKLLKDFDADLSDQKFYPESLDQLLSKYREILALNLDNQEDMVS
jgi:hypothetical protein